MKYLIRVLKYFVFITVLMGLILFVLSAAGLVEKNISAMFKNGYDSLWQIAIMFLAVSALYPKFGFCKRGATVPGPWEEVRPAVVSFMEDRGYVLEKEDGENLSFRKKSFIGRLGSLLFEDRITFERYLPGFYIEGRTRDVARIVSGLEYKFREED